MNGRKRFSIALVLLGALHLSAPAAHGVDHAVQVGPGTTYSPKFLTIQAGDTVTWTSAGGFHNVIADDESFRCADGCDGQGGDGSPGSGWSFTRAFNAVGVVGYHCEVHGIPGAGMFGTITVTGATAPGSLQFTAGTFSVGEAGGPASITISRTGGTDGAVSVQYATSNGTATAGSDYTAASGTLSWTDGDGANKSFPVPITNDAADEPNETVELTLSNPGGGASLGARTTATLTITDDDLPASAGSIAFGMATFSVAESGASATIPVVRSGGTNGAVSVAFATANGTATGGPDYAPINGVLTWANGESGTKNFQVGIVDDTLVEANETVLLALSSPTGGATLGSPANATLTIQDNDVPSGPGTLALGAASFSGTEGGTATITVSR
ncbi:MAG TPA: Calx-beta domain-containing protein, partial [Thermoanaerobaculia bacterium]|nr:Calx-beta domain-containing protein [Thermoanaerobaculia bacterium]